MHTTYSARHSTPHVAGLIGAAAGVAFLAAGCARQAATNAGPATTTPVAAKQPAKAQPTPAQPAASEPHAIHNVFRASDKLISGGVPEGDAGFDELAAMGVKTVISVDGAPPDLARATARGMRYVHIPITYAQATPEQQREIAKAVRDLPGPIYLHCHHGKHRGPAAAASALVVLGQMSPDEGVAFMKKAGTAPTYEGLYACVLGASKLPAETLDALDVEFTPLRRPDGLVAAMLDIEHAHDHLLAIRAAGWTVPKDHPDLVPAAEAGRLADSLRPEQQSDEAKRLGADYLKRTAAASAAAAALEEALARRAAPAELESLWTPVAASCKDCHRVHRDVVK